MKKLDESSPLKTLVFATEGKQSNFSRVNCNKHLDFSPKFQRIFHENNEVIELTYDEPRPALSSKNLCEKNFLSLLEEGGDEGIFGRKDKRSSTIMNFSDRKLNDDLKGGWLCPSCRNFNIEKNKNCGKCQKSPNKFQSFLDNKENIEPGNLSPIYPKKEINFDGSKDTCPQQTHPTNTMPNPPPMERSAKDKKKKLTERVGDWVCIKCKNLNFSFRVICNRCELPKTENDFLYEKYSNIANLNKIQEIFNKQSHLNQNYVNYINNQCYQSMAPKQFFPVQMMVNNSVLNKPYYGNMVPNQVNQMGMPCNGYNVNLRGNFIPNNYYK